MFNLKHDQRVEWSLQRLTAFIQHLYYCFGDHKSLFLFKQNLAEKECNQMRTQLQETRNIADDLEKVGKYNLKKHWSHSKYFIT